MLQKIKMSDTGSDAQNELSMLIKNYVALQAKDPEHPLLSFAHVFCDNRCIQFASGYNDKYVQPTDEGVISGYARYRSELEGALEAAVA